MNDNRIVELYLSRDKTAIQQTMEKYGSRLRALSFGIVKDWGAAEECENDAYREAWNAIPPHEPRTYLYPFLARIIRNIPLNCCRHRSRLKRSALMCELREEMELCLPAPNDLECRIDAMALGEAINGFLGGLDAEKRNVFVRRYWYLDSVADISARYDLSQSKVKTTLFRCRNGLREYLEKEGYVL